MLARYGEIKEIKDALNKAMVTSCPITYRNQTAMLKSSFIRMCLKNQQTKEAGWTDGHRGYELMYPQCATCETGKLIAAGLDFPQPAYTEWLEIGHCGLKTNPAIKRSNAAPLERLSAGTLTTKENDMEVKKEKPSSDGPFKTMPEVTDHLRLTDLREYWQRTPAPDNTIGTCVNCGRLDRKIRSVGLCSSCQSATIKKRGQDMLDGLAEARVRLWSDDSLRRAIVQKSRKKRKPEAAARKAIAAPAPAPAPAPVIQQEAAAPPVAPVPFITDLYRIGLQYKALGEKLMDQSATINELTAAAAQLGLKIDINIVTKREVADVL